MDKREKNMLVREKLGFLWRMLKGVTLGCIGALAIYLAEAILLADLFTDPEGDTTFIAMLLIQIAYLISVYYFYIRHEAKDYYVWDGRSGAWQILFGYLKSEGWMLAAVYAAVAVAAEITKTVMPEAIGNPIVFICVLNMPLSGVGIPILRAVIGYAVSVGAIFALTVIARILNADIGLSKKNKYIE